jgi:hypothetical protein
MTPPGVTGLARHTTESHAPDGKATDAEKQGR